MARLSDLPIRSKLHLVSMLPCLVGLLLATALLVHRDASRLSEDSESQVRVLAQIIADNSTAAVAFNDRETAEEILQSLKAHPEVLSARLLGADRSLFAEYVKNANDAPPLPSPGEDGIHRVPGALLVYQPVTQRGQRLGTLALRFSLAEVNKRQRQTLTIGGTVLIASLGAAFILSMGIQRLISGPILRLAATAAAVRETHDYGIRAAKSGDDEIGALIEAFNGMLARIQTREAELAETTRELAGSQERFELAVRGSSEGLWDWEVQSGHAWYSDLFKELLGYAPDELPDAFEALRSRLHPDDIGAFQEAFQRHATDNADYDVEYRLRTKAQGYRWFRACATSQRNGEGRVVRVVGSIQDITAQKLANQERERLLAVLNEKTRELEQIIYVTSHDLRSPLVNIQGFSKELRITYQHLAEMLSNEGPARVDELDLLLRTEIPEILDYIQGSASKMDHLLSGLLRISRLGRAPLEFRVLDMNALMKNVVAEFEYTVKERGIEVRVAELPSCFGDEGQLNQVFSNLVSNAIKYLDPRRPGVISITGTREGERAVFCVEDNGVGIPERHKTRIFEVFHRLNPTETEGEGLGLTIAKKCLERQNGTIGVESQYGKGSRFCVSMSASEFPVWEWSGGKARPT